MLKNQNFVKTAEKMVKLDEDLARTEDAVIIVYMEVWLTATPSEKGASSVTVQTSRGLKYQFH